MSAAQRLMAVLEQESRALGARTGTPWMFHFAGMIQGSLEIMDERDETVAQYTARRLGETQTEHRSDP